MTFYEISRKMLRANFSKYRLYFLCNLFAAAVFYCFAAIFTNRSFMNGITVDSSISNNIYLPSFLSAVFLIIFLPVSCQVFLSSRKQEYGIMLSIGMSWKEVFRNMLFENMAVAVCALAAALVVGTLLSFVFFFVIVYGIGIKGVQWQLSLEPYKITVFLYVATMIITIILHAGKLSRDRIGTLLKAPFHAEKKGMFYGMLCRLLPGYMKKHMLEWSLVRRHTREWGLRYVLASLIIACSVMLVSVCTALYPSFLHDAESYSPYDMVYSEIYGKNQVPLQNVISILKEHDVTVEQVKQIPYIRTVSFNYLPVTEVNQNFGCDYQIEEGQFLNLFQYDLEDGYEHDLQPVSAIEGNGGEKLYSVGSDVKILFNQNHTFADRTLIVSDSDFEKLAADSQCWTGTANLFLFDQWENAYEGICAVKEYLNSSNRVDEAEARYYELSSKVEKYQDAEKSGQFLIFLMIFVIGLMLTAEVLLIHFRIQAEQEENGRAIHSLYMLGAAGQEILKCLKYKNRLRFLPPLVFGTVLSFVPSYYFNESYGMGIKGFFAGMLFGMIILAGAIVSIYRYSEKELKYYI